MPARESRRAIIKNTIEACLQGTVTWPSVRLQFRERRGYGDACRIVDDSSFLLDTTRDSTQPPMNEAPSQPERLSTPHPLAENICHARGFHLC